MSTSKRDPQQETIETLSLALERANEQLLLASQKEAEYAQAFGWLLDELQHVGDCQHLFSWHPLVEWGKTEFHHDETQSGV